MSYTTKIKEEIASIENTKSEMIAELAGFIRNNGTIINDSWMARGVGFDYIYFDKDGNLCPTAANEIVFKVKGTGSYCAGANGDPVSLESFQEPHMHVFSGMMTAIVSSSEEPGKIVLEASSKGLKKAVIVINTYKE